MNRFSVILFIPLHYHLSDTLYLASSLYYLLLFALSTCIITTHRHVTFRSKLFAKLMDSTDRTDRASITLLLIFCQTLNVYIPCQANTNLGNMMSCLSQSKALET
jgi:hypothetical protein